MRNLTFYLMPTDAGKNKKNEQQTSKLEKMSNFFGDNNFMRLKFYLNQFTKINFW